MVTGSCHQDTSETVQGALQVAEDDRDAEGEQVVQDVQRDPGLEPADEDDDQAGHQSEREPVEEQREVLRAVRQREQAPTVTHARATPTRRAGVSEPNACIR